MISIKILGPGCKRCKATFDVIKQALEQSGVSAEIIKIEDYEGMMKYNILATPVVVVDDQIKIQGRVPTIEEIIELLNQYV